MKKETYALLENYMRASMSDSAHDSEHVYRVLHTALYLAQKEKADLDVLICACLLHDVGREAQRKDPSLCHARVGAEMAYAFLTKHQFGEAFASHVQDCIRTHRFSRKDPPQTIEAKILFDADKIDVVGAMGIARTLLFEGKMDQPLYLRDEAGNILLSAEKPSFFGEYHRKLEKLYNGFYTESGKALAASRKKAAEDFYQSLLGEVKTADEQGKALLDQFVEEE